MKKIAIIGAGNVGAHVVSAVISKNIPLQCFLIDRNEKFEEGQVLDLKDSLLFSHRVQIRGADLDEKEVRNADIFVITAGVKQKEGETRTDLLGRNIEVLKSISKELGTVKKTAIIILITNPVDILTQVAQEIFNLPRTQVIGTGTLLDTSRLRWRLAEKFDINISNAHGYVLGEHGDTGFVAWSTVKNADKISLEEKEKIEAEVKDAAYKIIEGKGATYFGIASMTAEILDAIVSDSGQVFPISVPLEGEYGIDGMAIGVPAKIGTQGVKKVVEKDLSKKELIQLQASAKILKELLNNLK